MFDLRIHSPKTREEVEELNPSELWNKINSEVTMMEGMENLGGGREWGHGSARLGTSYGVMMPGIKRIPCE